MVTAKGLRGREEAVNPRSRFFDEFKLVQILSNKRTGDDEQQAATKFMHAKEKGRSIDAYQLVAHKIPTRTYQAFLDTTLEKS